MCTKRYASEDLMHQEINKRFGGKNKWVDKKNAGVFLSNK